MPNVSVILPTYNRPKSLGAAIASVLSQSYKDIELIIVDDASSEDVKAVVDSFEDERVRFVRRSSNGGAAAARNTGLLAAKGRFIAFQDSDDLWLPGKLERQIALFESLPTTVGVVTGGKIVYGLDSTFTYGPGRICYAPPPGNALKLDDDQLTRLLEENRLSVQNALFRRDCLPRMPWFDVNAKANEDWALAIELAKVTTLFEDIEPVVLGFVSNDSISARCNRHTIGLVRILKSNRDILKVRSRQHSLLLIELSRSLFSAGKRRLAAKFLVASFRVHPAHLRLLPGFVWRKVQPLLFGRLFRAGATARAQRRPRLPTSYPLPAESGGQTSERAAAR